MTRLETSLLLYQNNSCTFQNHLHRRRILRSSLSALTSGIGWNTTKNQSCMYTWQLLPCWCFCYFDCSLCACGDGLCNESVHGGTGYGQANKCIRNNNNSNIIHNNNNNTNIQMEVEGGVAVVVIKTMVVVDTVLASYKVVNL